MRCLKLGFLMAVMLVSSGYRYRCYWACTDQTAIQNDYTEQRDTCRSYAEAKVDFSLKTLGKSGDGNAKNAQLVALFSECMSKHGWTVPDGKDKNAAAPVAAPATTGVAAAAAGSPAGPSVAPTNVAAAQDKAILSRNAECNFARMNAAVSSIANARAQACDMECSQRLQNAPDAPRPAACPSTFKSGLGKGVYKE